MMRTSNPALSAEVFEVPAGGNVMTVDGTVNKTGILLFLAVVGATWTWRLFTSTVDESGVSTVVFPWMIGGLLGEGLDADFEPVWAPLDAALRDFRSVVDAGRRRIAVLPFRAAAVDPAGLAKIDRKLSAFKEKAAERFANRRISLLDDEADRVYRQAFKDLARDLDALEARLRRVMSDISWTCWPS